MSMYMNYICYVTSLKKIHAIFFIDKYVLLKKVCVQMKCILSLYHIYIHNSVAHMRMKWNSYVFDILDLTTIWNPNVTLNILCIPYVI